MEPPISADPWAEEVDSFDAANILGITVNHLRQLVFKKKIETIGKHKRRAMFKRIDVMKLKEMRAASLKAEREAIGVSQADLPQDD